MKAQNSEHRVYFAGLAMQSLIRGVADLDLKRLADNPTQLRREIAENAVLIADAMIERLNDEKRETTQAG